MIASVRGIIQHVGQQEVVLEVGGIGVQISVPQAVLGPATVVGQAMFLYTRLIVREDSLSLYGFGSVEQREVFDLLLQVSGVGPRLAVTILSHLPPDGLRAAVAGDQPAALTRVPGIGRKTAEKIIFHLKDRLAAVRPAQPAAEGDAKGLALAKSFDSYEATMRLATLTGVARDLETFSATQQMMRMQTATAPTPIQVPAPAVAAGSTAAATKGSWQEPRSSHTTSRAEAGSPSYAYLWLISGLAMAVAVALYLLR
jgi:Holliday junction DNA helicase RuvA